VANDQTVSDGSRVKFSETTNTPSVMFNDMPKLFVAFVFTNLRLSSATETTRLTEPVTLIQAGHRVRLNVMDQ
jgi:hypothetical protein